MTDRQHAERKLLERIAAEPELLDRQDFQLARQVLSDDAAKEWDALARQREEAKADADA